MTIEAAHHHIVLQAVILWSIILTFLFVIGVKVFLIHEDVRRMKERLDEKDDKKP
jgi:hypothetical protein